MIPNMHEIETKILEVSPRLIAAKLKKLGAKQALKTRLVVDWFGPRGLTHAGDDPWFLRVRTGANKTEITWKTHSKILGASRSHKEINVAVSSHGQACAILSALGLENYAHQEKDRTSWTLRQWKFDLDQYPGMPPYLEIESSSEQNIQKAIALLDLTKHRALPEGERTLINREYKLNWCNMRFKKRRV